MIVLDFDLKKHGNYRIYSIDWVQCYLDSFDWGRLSELIEPSLTSYHGNSRISVGKVWTPVSTLIWRRSMISFSKYKRTFLVAEFVELRRWKKFLYSSKTAKMIVYLGSIPCWLLASVLIAASSLQQSGKRWSLNLRGFQLLTKLLLMRRGRYHSFVETKTLI